MQKRVTAIILSLAFPFSVFAAAYPDVPTNSQYSHAIYDLQRLGIMTGNANGTFGYGEYLNRAALLTLAYRAAKKNVRAIYYDGSFRDVPEGEWFTDVIYTAKHDGVIQGNPDGTARPGFDANLVESLKIILNALSIPIPELTQEDRISVGGFVGTTTGAWYLPWLNAAFILNLLPEPLLANNELNPSAPITREIAAEMLYRTMHADLSLLEDREIIQNGDEEKEVMDVEPETTVTGTSIDGLPIHAEGKTGERGASSYAFKVEEKQTVLVAAENVTSASAGIDCFLYLLGESGFSSEFFIGYKQGGTCTIRAALRPGTYQVEIRSPSQGASYTLNVDSSTGDGNDGFVEAIPLTVGSPKNGTLAPNDYQDWYKFIVTKNEPHRIRLDPNDKFSCLLFPAANVDLSSFSVPKCGETTDYDAGTWYVSIKKKSGVSENQGYTVELR